MTHKDYWTMAVYGIYKNGNLFYMGRYNANTGKPDLEKYASHYVGNAKHLEDTRKALEAKLNLTVKLVPWWM